MLSPVDKSCAGSSQQLVLRPLVLLLNVRGAHCPEPHAVIGTRAAGEQALQTEVGGITVGGLIEEVQNGAH